MSIYSGKDLIFVKNNATLFVILKKGLSWLYNGLSKLIFSRLTELLQILVAGDTKPNVVEETEHGGSPSASYTKAAAGWGSNPGNSEYKFIFHRMLGLFKVGIL